MKDLHVELVRLGPQAVPVPVRMEVRTIDPCELLLRLQVTNPLEVPRRGERLGNTPTAGKPTNVGRNASGAQPHQGIGAFRGTIVRVVHGVRMIAGLGHLLDADHLACEENLVGDITVVVVLDDCHGSIVSGSPLTLRSGRDAAEGALFEESGLGHAEDVGAAVAAEAVLGDFEDAFAEGFAALVLVDEEGAADVDGVEDGLFAGEVARLGDLADEDDDAVVGLGPVREHFDRADRGHRVGAAVGVLAVVEGLERVLEDEDLLAGVGLAELVGVSEEVFDERVLSCDEAVLEVEALRDHLHLVERLLTGVVEADVACLGDGVRELEHHRGLACAGGAGEHHDRGGDEAFAAESVVEPVEAGALAGAESVRDRDLVDVGSALKTLDADVEVHLAHVVFSTVPVGGCR